MTGLVSFVDYTIGPITVDTFDALAAAAPADPLQAFLLRHVRCVAGRPDALELVPPIAVGGSRGRCLHCGVEQRLPDHVKGESAPVQWWGILLAAMARENADVFIREGGAFLPERFRACEAAIEAAISRCVLLMETGDVEH